MSLADNDGHGIGPHGWVNLGVYPSVTMRGGNIVLWHAEPKVLPARQADHRRQAGRLDGVNRIESG
jgi:hypothetical protein